MRYAKSFRMKVRVFRYTFGLIRSQVAGIQKRLRIQEKLFVNECSLLLHTVLEDEELANSVLQKSIDCVPSSAEHEF